MLERLPAMRLSLLACLENRPQYLIPKIRRQSLESLRLITLTGLTMNIRKEPTATWNLPVPDMQIRYQIFNAIFIIVQKMCGEMKNMRTNPAQGLSTIKF